ncbi:MAG: amidohydrolase family protein [Muribaculaceae bacterium]|nr:amidohydrolase family protein [Muribaculaceae bacterium]
MEKPNFTIKGNICHTTPDGALSLHPDSYLVCENGVCTGVFPQLPDWAPQTVIDYGDLLVIPGLNDLHIHAPQFTFRGLGMDRELMQWLETYTFPEEAKYKALEYADEAYTIFADHMRRSATTRACVFATIHRPATELLMQKMEETGLVTYVGKVNMDQMSPQYLIEDTAQSERDTIDWLEATIDRFARTKPIITPRFIPTCSSQLLAALGRIAADYNIPVQSHLSENREEIAIVSKLEPDAASYGHAYDKYGLLGGNSPCVMAHCVHSSDIELELIRKRGVFIAHSPESNLNVSSGIAPIARYLDMGLNVGLATDVAGGSSECMFKAMAHAIQSSHMYWRLIDDSWPQLTFADVFHMATRISGAFFGKVGAFDPGYAFDALVIDDSNLLTPKPLTLTERLERLPYLATPQHIVAKYINATPLF